jgi:farnesyl-diphosphate farnesyltransferase
MSYTSILRAICRNHKNEYKEEKLRYFCYNWITSCLREDKALSKEAKLHKEAMHMLKLTSRTFYIPIKLLKPTLRETVGAAYLCMRAIDEIEDHETLPKEVKIELLRETSNLLKTNTGFDRKAYKTLIEPYPELPEVTQRLADWIEVCPAEITRKVLDSTSEMANGMAKWVEKEFVVHTKEELDEYTYYVAGLVGVMLSDIWKWYDGTETDHDLAIGYGRGLQAVNMLRNQEEDAERGVNFLPDGWTRSDLFDYAWMNLGKADQYMKQLETKNIILFCRIPLELAKKTLKAMDKGHEKMTRKEVEETVDGILEEEA